jgi:general secretion pathway protein D
MRRLTRPLALALVVLTIALPAAADKAKDLYKKGKDAEARQNYEAAFDFYRQAYDLKPKELWYRTAYERTKFLAAAAHVHRGHLLRDAGKLDEALAEFQRAMQIDPSSFIAQQEVRRTQQMIEEGKSGAPQARMKSQDSLARRVQQATGPMELAPIANVPITLKLSEDTKVIYETVGKLAGINVLFDPDYTSRRIRIELNGVTLQEALEIIALESKTFWRPVTPNTIFVAADTLQKRKEIEQSVIKTFYLSNLSAQTELTDVVNTLRTILEVSRVQPLPSQGAIVVRGTPDQIALAEKLVGDLDKARPEVVVEVAIMSVSRDKMRQLGINPPTTASVALNSNLTTTGSSSNQTNALNQTNTTGTSGATNQVNLNRIGNLQATDFVVTIPQATATALLSDNTTKIVQNPQIRSLDGQKASLKIGQRVPVATGSFQPGIGGVGINPLVNTQFQYLDVGVNIDITPHVHASREVSMKIMLDVSSVVSQTNIGGINQPVIGQRKIEHEIRLKEGEVNLLGGIFDQTDTQALSGIPWLAQIPILHYLFGQTNKEHVEDEIVFALVPHIVRGTEVSEFNEKPLDVGTANAIELHMAGGGGTARPVNTGAMQTGGAQPVPVPAPTQQMPQQPGTMPGNQQAPANPQQQQPANPQQPQGGPTTLSFDPPSVSPTVGSTFAVNLTMSGAQNVYSVPVQLSYDPKTLQLVNVSNGGLLSSDGQAVALVNRDDATTGTLQVTATRPPGASGVSGQGTIFTLTFLAKAPGNSTLAITRGGARDAANQALQVSTAPASVSVH